MDDVHIFGSQLGDVKTSPVPVTANIEPAMEDVYQLEYAIADWAARSRSTAIRRRATMS